jgi:hypothetical protein
VIIGAFAGSPTDVTDPGNITTCLLAGEQQCQDILIALVEEVAQTIILSTLISH